MEGDSWRIGKCDMIHSIYSWGVKTLMISTDIRCLVFSPICVCSCLVWVNGSFRTSQNRLSPQIRWLYAKKSKAAIQFYIWFTLWSYSCLLFFIPNCRRPVWGDCHRISVVLFEEIATESHWISQYPIAGIALGLRLADDIITIGYGKEW